MRKLLLAVAVCASACAPKLVPTPVVTDEKYPQFRQPAIPPALAASPAALTMSRGWAFLQIGDLRTAEHEFDTALKIMPAFYPAEASLGYVELARRDAKAALPHFDRAIAQNADQADLSTLVGRGESLLSLGREDDARTAFEAAMAADPSRADLAQRVEVLKFRSAEQRLARAREAARAGRLDEALQTYTAAIAASPDSPFLYRELAGVERQKGSLDAALEHFRKAVALDSSDARSQAQIGEMLEASGDVEGAERAYAASLAIEANPEVDKRAAGLRSRMALERMPAEYRAIDSAAQITRADLAALIGIRLPGLLLGGRRSGDDAALITDVRTNWAATWIMSVARAGVMEPFANHAFQPRTVVRRTDLAQAAAQLLARVAAQNPARARAWESARPGFSDLSPNHLAYPAASVAVASGVMKTGSDDSFQPSRVVTGPEAIEVIGKIEALAASR
jgi:tetratricopeptide (TPR) repeat protein